MKALPQSTAAPRRKSSPLHPHLCHLHQPCTEPHLIHMQPSLATAQRTTSRHKAACHTNTKNKEVLPATFWLAGTSGLAQHPLLDTSSQAPALWANTRDEQLTLASLKSFQELAGSWFCSQHVAPPGSPAKPRPQLPPTTAHKSSRSVNSRITAPRHCLAAFDTNCSAECVQLATPY